MKIHSSFFLILFLSITHHATSQSVEIQGEAKVTEMSNENHIDDIVVRKPDGTLATRSAQSLPASFEDTVRSLNTDFDLAKHLCDCGTDLPPYLIESLLASGYTPEDLMAAGVPIANVIALAPVVDLDGNEYDVITIGTQKWLKQNLRVTQFSDGTPIPLSLSSTEWSASITAKEPAFCYPGNDGSNIEEYGLLYNAYTVLDDYNGNKEVCPTGWRTPTRPDFQTLREEIDPGSSDFTNSAGAALKKKGTDEWQTPNLGANNFSGFTSYPAGSRYPVGTIVFYNRRAYNLTSSLNGTSALYRIILHYDKLKLDFSPSSFEFATGTIRCIKE